MSVDIPEPLALPDELLPLLEDIDRRVARECAKHRSHYVRRFADDLLDLLWTAHDEAVGERRAALFSVIGIVKALAEVEK